MKYKCKRDFFTSEGKYYEKDQYINEEEYLQLMFKDQEYFEAEPPDL